ncbi:hypothetical protein [uncultured Deefgea sp.]|uniref:hypothetical protein n=1 Tax=uncultured Deefgea sp. TaxID=1304914 RepID=UPI002599C359|nr:hypothetical protein [uncultured Deefgea sp.]
MARSELLIQQDQPLKQYVADIQNKTQTIGSLTMELAYRHHIANMSITCRCTSYGKLPNAAILAKTTPVCWVSTRESDPLDRTAAPMNDYRSER